MNKWIKSALRPAFAVAILACAAAPLAWAAGYFTNGVPVAGGSQYPGTVPLTGLETLPADTNLASGQNPASEAIQTQQLVAYIGGTPVRSNAIIGGDASTNLWQRGTAGTATSNGTPAYNGPDRFAQWATSAGAQVTLSRDSTAGDLIQGYEYAFKLAHTNTTAGQICMAQEVESVNSYQFAGTTAELDFHAVTGAGFTGSATGMTAYIVYGTGTDEGIAKMAYTVNVLSGTSSGWTGGAQATAAVINLGGVSTSGRYSAVANIPATATEIGVALCYTASTTDTNDYIAFSGIQLTRNPANASYANASAGYNDTAYPAASFERRTQAQESLLQYRYAYALNEADTGTAGSIQSPAGMSNSATVCWINIPFPTPMRAIPTYTNALSGSTFTITGGDHAPQALSTPLSALLQQGATAGATGSASMVFTTGATQTQYYPCLLTSTASGTGVLLWTAEL